MGFYIITVRGQAHMRTLIKILQYLEWIFRFALLTPGQRRMVIRPHRPRAAGPGPESPGHGPVQLRAHWIGETCPPGLKAVGAVGPVLQSLTPELILVVTGCVIFVTACSLVMVSLGWLEALYDIPIFIITLLAALMCGGFKRRG